MMFAAIFEEGHAIVESQRPELHLRSDRMATAYRTWLRQLGLQFGAA